MRKFVASVAAASTLAAGGVAVAVVNPFQSAGAQTAPPTTAPAPRPGHAGHHKGDSVTAVLNDLVAKGTITKAQEDAIVQAFKHGKVELRHGAWRHGMADRKELGTVVAKALGITPQDLQAQVKSGKSIADIAADRKVDVNAVTGAVTSAIDARIDQAVSSGKLDAAKAATMKAKVAQTVDKLVNHHRKPGK